MDLAAVFSSFSGFSPGKKVLSVPSSERFFTLFRTGGEAGFFAGAAREAASCFSDAAGVFVYAAKEGYYRLEANFGSLLPARISAAMLQSPDSILYAAAEIDERKAQYPIFLGTIYIPNISTEKIFLVFDRNRTSFPPGLLSSDNDVLIKKFNNAREFSVVATLDCGKMRQARFIPSIVVAPLLDGERRKGIGSIVMVGKRAGFLGRHSEEGLHLKRGVDFAQNLSEAYQRILRQSRY
ncbi:hypothetical protein A2276_00310 [candidate division WOR-1 bacterium RIFOXYA12_FULL_43_27]|uniref:Uncharacterized protein n=1 Tax=candidate division WOR-1 bacterium RIFOXYC2_FULL_46_14 TaxID=1802587 RepID=A0A1F4U4L4_UNCSA|nr:MAG: hypothetical protein A2276_00310 [candidate division WOR-1 bacterium RIFOXYA12_FULL_43_27]OGC20861.1 MAG: hypothetical protein A2292_07565 [candidate division WOR-1 bacterium RIFOXYB2_FULL_46_45]OGC31401.1 MAG: hypothetical protein A2232_03880 [candidate division WOR-1 bacterium RIFOXYA2_FULL_46_56]OGC39807.1 MAG: hypothetical protein A2438_04715 [candidate division WOR-1 bacterium RIFOXYC2_FULL_46_14]